MRLPLPNPLQKKKISMVFAPKHDELGVDVAPHNKDSMDEIEVDVTPHANDGKDEFDVAPRTDDDTDVGQRTMVTSSYAAASQKCCKSSQDV